MVQPRFEKVIPRDSSFLAYMRQMDRFPFEWHYHPEYEIVAILKSEGELFVGDHLDIYRAGELVMTGPTLPHTWKSKAGTRENKAIVIQFGHNFLGDAFFTAPEFAHIRLLLSASRHGLAFQGSVKIQAITLMRKLLKEKGISRILRLIELLDLLSQTTSKKRRLSSRLFDEITSDTERSQFERSFMEIVKNYKEPLRQSNVAKNLHMTPATFSRIFKRHCGRGFTRCLIEYRVAIACRLLQETDLHVTEICFQCGFLTLSNFNRQFLKVKGISPRAYRNKWYRQFR